MYPCRAVALGTQVRLPAMKAREPPPAAGSSAPSVAFVAAALRPPDDVVTQQDGPLGNGSRIRRPAELSKGIYPLSMGIYPAAHPTDTRPSGHRLALVMAPPLSRSTVCPAQVAPQAGARRAGTDMPSRLLTLHPLPSVPFARTILTRHP